MDGVVRLSEVYVAHGIRFCTRQRHIHTVRGSEIIRFIYGNNSTINQTYEINLVSLSCSTHTHTHTHTRFNGPLSGITRVSRYQKGKTNLDFTEARDSEWQWHQLGHMQVCI